MTDDTFRQERRKVTKSDLGEETGPLESVRQIQEAVAQETGREVVKHFEQSPMQIAGKIPPEFQRAIQERSLQTPIPAKPQVEDGFEAFDAPPERPQVKRPVATPAPTPDKNVKQQGSDQLENLLEQLSAHHQWEEFEFPSRGKFYTNIPSVIHLRPMTGEEEQILATPRFVKRGKAIDMIFQRCIKETIPTEDLLSSDRTHLLIYLRGISYTPEYDVEIKCPNCQMKYAHLIDLNELEVDSCPDSFGAESLQGVLPATGFRYRYRLATGNDEQEIANYRERRIQQWGDQSQDDTLLYRTALLLEEIEGVTMKKELALLLKRLPIQDVSHLRNEINTPPFGVNTEIAQLCPACNEEFKIDLPLETNFFFPRKKTERTPV